MGSSGTWSALSFSSMTAVRRPQAWESLLPLTRDRVRTWIRRHPPPGKPFCQIDLGGDGMANQRTGFFETLRFGVRGAYPNNTEAIVNIRISERALTPQPVACKKATSRPTANARPPSVMRLRLSRRRKPAFAKREVPAEECDRLSTGISSPKRVRPERGARRGRTLSGTPRKLCRARRGTGESCRGFGKRVDWLVRREDRRG